MMFFNGLQIPGEHGPLIVPSPDLNVRRVKIWQLVGEAEIVGKPGGRTIVVQVLIHDGYEQPQFLQEFLRLMDSWVGTNGTLKVESEAEEAEQQLNHEYKFCTFEGFEPDPETPGPLPDVGGLLDEDDNGDPLVGAWFIIGWLRFRQLVPKLKI